MDIVGLLAAVAALVAYPGGAYALAGAWSAAVGGRLPLSPEGWSVGTVAAAACAIGACAGAPLPGSPALALPDRSGAPADLVTSIVLLACAVGFGGSTRWLWRRVVAAAAAAIPPLCLGAAAATFDASVIAALPGRDLEVARITAALAVIVAVPQLVVPGELAPPRGLRAVVLAAAAVVAAGIAAPDPAAGLPAAVTAGVVLGATAVYALVVGWAGRRILEPPALWLAVAVAATSAVLALRH